MKKSAGILLYRFNNKVVEFLLVHPGGPFWRNKDEGAWSIPKGEFEEEEKALQTAIREFEEELGTPVSGTFTELMPVKQLGGKTIYAWALQGDLDVNKFRSNSFETEWPPRSGIKQKFPEVDKAAWFDASTAIDKINPAQAGFIKEMVKALKKSTAANQAALRR